MTFSNRGICFSVCIEKATPHAPFRGSALGRADLSRFQICRPLQTPTQTPLLVFPRSVSLCWPRWELDRTKKNPEGSLP